MSSIVLGNHIESSFLAEVLTGTERKVTECYRPLQISIVTLLDVIFCSSFPASTWSSGRVSKSLPRSSESVIQQFEKPW